MFDDVETALGPVDILLNNAAHCELPDTILALTASTLDRHFMINTRAAVMLAAELAIRIRQRKSGFGRVIIISTDVAQVFPRQIAYGASKAAIESFTRSMAI